MVDKYFRATSAGNVPFTPEEEAAEDARLAAIAAQELIDAPIKAREAAKQVRTVAVEAITVTTTTGKVFDGNPQALQFLTSAYVAGSANNITTTFWTLADNSRVEVTPAEIKEAMTLSGLAISALWERP